MSDESKYYVNYTYDLNAQSSTICFSQVLYDTLLLGDRNQKCGDLWDGEGLTGKGHKRTLLGGGSNLSLDWGGHYTGSWM